MFPKSRRSPLSHEFSTGSRFYLFKTARNSAKEITKMVEVYSDECQPGIKYSMPYSVHRVVRNDLDHVWAPLYKLIKGSEKIVSSSVKYGVPFTGSWVGIFRCTSTLRRECVC